MMDGLRVPFPLAGRRIETDNRLGEQIHADAPPAPVVAAWRRRRQVQESPCLVYRQWSPHVCMACLLPRVVRPRVGTKIPGRLRNGEKDPDALSGADVER